MNKSRWATEGNLHFPLKATTGATGKVTVTCHLAEGKSWEGDSVEQATRRARTDLQRMQAEAQLAVGTPKFMTDGSWKGKVI